MLITDQSSLIIITFPLVMGILFAINNDCIIKTSLKSKEEDSMLFVVMCFDLSGHTTKVATGKMHIGDQGSLLVDNCFG